MQCVIVSYLSAPPMSAPTIIDRHPASDLYMIPVNTEKKITTQCWSLFEVHTECLPLVYLTGNQDNS